MSIVRVLRCALRRHRFPPSCHLPCLLVGKTGDMFSVCEEHRTAVAEVNSHMTPYCVMRGPKR